MVHGPGPCVRRHPHRSVSLSLYPCSKDPSHVQVALLRTDVAHKGACYGPGEAYEVNLPPVCAPLREIDRLRREGVEWLIRREPMLRHRRLRNEECTVNVPMHEMWFCLTCALGSR